uniref:Uncharacterized protein n=1 Tax=Daphnia magna TaxID=35525 RepID=A0A0P5SYU9_9CRUS
MAWRVVGLFLACGHWPRRVPRHRTAATPSMELKFATQSSPMQKMYTRYYSWYTSWHYHKQVHCFILILSRKLAITFLATLNSENARPLTHLQSNRPAYHRRRRLSYSQPFRCDGTDTEQQYFGCHLRPRRKVRCQL